MMRDKYRNSGTVAAGVVLLIIFALIVLSIARYFWVEVANEHYDTLISAYIREMKDYEAEDQGKLRKQLLEDGIFIKMHRWDKESFVKDRELYNEMIKAYEIQQRKREEREGGLIDDVINL
jgi:hypothetical protein